MRDIKEYTRTETWLETGILKADFVPGKYKIDVIYEIEDEGKKDYTELLKVDTPTECIRFDMYKKIGAKRYEDLWIHKSTIELL